MLCSTFCSFLKLFRSYKTTKDQEENHEKPQKAQSLQQVELSVQDEVLRVNTTAHSGNMDVFANGRVRAGHSLQSRVTAFTSPLQNMGREQGLEETRRREDDVMFLLPYCHCEKSHQNGPVSPTCASAAPTTTIPWPIGSFYRPWSIILVPPAEAASF